MSNWWTDTFFTKRFWLGIEKNYGDIPEGLGVTVVIPAYNEAACIGDTIRALQASTYPVKIIVVDDCSSDNTGDIARSFEGVTVLRPEKNNGTKSRALNYALPYVNTPIFICVDADTIVEPGSIVHMLPFFNDPKVGIVSGYVLTQRSQNVWDSGRLGEYIYGQMIYKNAQNHINCILVASGCFSAMRTDLLREFGGYKERSIAEDMDLTWEFIEAGYTVKFAKKAVCRVIDPYSGSMFHSQVARWYRGYFQCIKVRNYNLFKKNPKLGLVAYFYILMNLFCTPLMLMTILSMFQVSLISAIISIVVYFTIFLWLPMIVKGLLMKIRFSNLLRAVVSMPIVYLFTIGIFFESAVKELVLNRQLTVWVKGH